MQLTLKSLIMVGLILSFVNNVAQIFMRDHSGVINNDITSFFVCAIVSIRCLMAVNHMSSWFLAEVTFLSVSFLGDFSNIHKENINTFNISENYYQFININQRCLERH